MSSLLVILIGTVLANTFLLMQSNETLGGDRHSGSTAIALRIGTASSVAFLLATVSIVLIHAFATQWPNDAFVLLFSLAVVSITLLLDRATRQRFPQLRRALASSPLLIVANSLALGTTLFMPLTTQHPVNVIGLAISVSITFMILLVAFIALVARITEHKVPIPFRLAPITLISAGLLALALMGFTGILRV